MGLKKVAMALLLCLPAFVLAQIPDPVDGDIPQILASKSTDLLTWRPRGGNNIILLDFPDLLSQGRTFNRITQMKEQSNEPYKKVLTFEEMDSYLSSVRRTNSDLAVGNDALVSDMALFFNLARRDKIELTPEEQHLLEFILRLGLIRDWRGIYQPIQAGTVLISIPQVTEKTKDAAGISKQERTSIFFHEIAHAEYFTNPYYSKYCRQFWEDSLSDAHKQAFHKFLANRNYVTTDYELVVNEMQAYLMFTPSPSAFSARLLGVTEDELGALREKFRKGKPPLRFAFP